MCGRFLVKGLIEGQWYSYRIKAFNKLGAGKPCRATDEIQAVDAKGQLTHPYASSASRGWIL